MTIVDLISLIVLIFLLGYPVLKKRIYNRKEEQNENSETKQKNWKL